jgi:hypothetical protein
MGKDIEQVREEAGHRDVSTTQRYARALRGHAEASSQTIVRFYRRGVNDARSPPPYRTQAEDEKTVEADR